MNEPRTPQARKARKAGYFIREGSYQNTPDDRLGRWYVCHQDDDFFRPFGAGYPSQRAAWEAAVRRAQDRGDAA